ncbi:MAG: hypothetical protein IRY90_13930, partial [Actinomadura rubrobrunea]|nr:hypothetical protein [Actinomadura rubrobrunea]
MRSVVDGPSAAGGPGDMGGQVGELLTLPVPETLRATYVAGLAAPTADPRELVRERVARRVAPPLRDLLSLIHNSEPTR